MASSGPKVEIESLGGWCPVQAEGRIEGLPFYFRARGEHWSLAIASTPDGDVFAEDSWVHREYYGEQYTAGWMEHAEAREKLLQAADRWWRQRQQAQALASGHRVSLGASNQEQSSSTLKALRQAVGVKKDQRR